MPQGVRLVAIGSELINGFIQDTNSQYFASKFYELGVELIEVRVIPDDFDACIKTLNELILTGDFIITTGGLGPTDDDLTVDVLSKITGQRVIEDEHSVKRLQNIINSGYKVEKDSSLNERIFRQCRILENSTALKNPVGLAPGIFLPGIPLIALPGFPLEIEGLWPKVEEQIQRIIQRAHKTKTIPLWGVSESRLFDSVEFPGEVHAGVHALSWGSRLFLKCGKEHEDLFEKTISSVESLFSACIVDNPATAVIRHLMKENITLGTVESCTGGLGGKIITDNPGVSQIYRGSLVTYHNEIKSGLAGVSEETLQLYGAVSAETAFEMARGGVRRLDVDRCIALTGIAGPDGGTKEKPAGTVFISIADKNLKSVFVKKYFFPFGRDRFRDAAIYSAFLALYQKEAVYDSFEKWFNSEPAKGFIKFDF